MFSRLLLASVLIAALGAAGGGTQPEKDEAAPRLRALDVVGRTRITLEGEPEELAEHSWPFIPSGATVRVLKGRAVFDGDLPVRFLVKEGCGFYFASHESENGGGAAIHVSAFEGCKTPLELDVAGRRALFGPDAALSIVRIGSRALSIRCENGKIDLPDGDIRRESTVLFESLSRPHELRPGDVISLETTSQTRWDLQAAQREEARLVRRGKSAFEARREDSGLSREESADRLIAGWRPAAQGAAEWALEKYGAPDQLNAASLSWIGKGSWSKTTVYRDDSSQEIPQDHWNILEQSIALAYPKSSANTLEDLKIGVHATPDGGGLTAISESEETNFLAINLAADFLKGRRGAKETRDLYYRQRALWNDGRTSPYLEGPVQESSVGAALRDSTDEARR